MHTFGPNATWWAVLILTWGILVVFEVVQKQLRQFLLHAELWPPSLSLLGWQRKGTGTSSRAERTTEALDVEVWQELEKDLEMRERLRVMAEDDVVEHANDDIDDIDRVEEEKQC